MTTFEKRLLMSGYSRLLKKNKEISGIRDLFASYVSDVLSEEDKKFFGKEDLSGFEGYLESLKPYHQVLQDEGIDCSIKMTEIFILGQNIKEFKKFIRNENVKYLIESGKIENMMLFFGEKGIIKTKEDLENGFSDLNWVKLKYLILYCKSVNIRIFFGEKGIIKTKEDLENAFNNLNRDRLKHLILNGKSENIRLFFGEKFYYIKTLEELKGVFNNPNWDNIYELIEAGKIENISLLFGEQFYNIKSKEDLEKLFKYPKWNKIRHLFLYGELENIKLFFGEKFFNIKTSVDFIEFINTYHAGFLVKVIANSSLDECKKVFKKIISNTIGFLPFGIVKFETSKSLGVCDDNEKYNERVLNGLDKNYVVIYFKKQPLGYIKKIGDNTFLSLVDLYDENGNLVLIKGGIYYIEGYKNLIEQKRIDLTTETILDMNFLRFIEISEKKLDAFRKKLEGSN